MGGYKIRNQHHAHFLTMTVVGWVDIFSRKIYKDIIIDSLKFCMDHKMLRVHAFVIMSNHIHLVAQTDYHSGLSAVVRDFKKFTSQEILRTFGSNKESRREWLRIIFEYHAKFSSNHRKQKFWKAGNHPIELESPRFFNQKIMYIHNNPVKAGIVRKPEDYIYSSASNYVSGEGLLEVDVVDFGFDVGYLYL